MKSNLTKAVVFAVAFGFIEAAVVVYLRLLVGSNMSQTESTQPLLLLPGIAFLHPQAAADLIKNTVVFNMERAREAATLVILFLVAAIAVKNLKQKIAFFFLMFGIWDIFYYVFLKLAIGWPKSFSDPDIFFLLPTPWVGPVIVPISISVVFISISLWYLLKVVKS